MGQKKEYSQKSCFEVSYSEPTFMGRSEGYAQDESKPKSERIEQDNPLVKTRFANLQNLTFFLSFYFLTDKLKFTRAFLTLLAEFSTETRYTDAREIITAHSVHWLPGPSVPARVIKTGKLHRVKCTLCKLLIYLGISDKKATFLSSSSKGSIESKLKLSDFIV